MRRMPASNYLSKFHVPGASQCSKSGPRTQVHVRKLLNSSEQTQGRLSTVNNCDKHRARPFREGPQTSERLSSQKADRDTQMDNKAEASCPTLAAASSLLVMLWCGPRSQLAPQPALCFFLATSIESTYCRTYLFTKKIYSG